MKHLSPSPFKSDALVKTTDDGCVKLHRPLRTLDDISVPQPQAQTSNPCSTMTEQQLRLILKARRRRGRFFSPDLFADPAWDILLELYAAKLGQRKVSVSSLCVGAAVPATTALRWIGTLEKNGLLVRTADRCDARRFFVSLSERAASSMAAYFEQQSGILVC